LDYKRSKKDGPQNYTISLSQDGENWSEPVATGSARPEQTFVDFPAEEARFVKVEITHATTKLFWSIHELDLMGRYK